MMIYILDIRKSLAFFLTLDVYFAVETVSGMMIPSTFFCDTFVQTGLEKIKSGK
jgi:hypothetical protein